MSHRIENLTINCSDPSTLEDFEQGQDFSAWVQTTVLQAIDEVLSKFDDSDIEIEIDELNLDLGDIHQDTFKQEFLAKLEANLELQLNEVWKDKNASAAGPFSSFDVTSEFLDKTKQKSKRGLQSVIHDGLYGKNVQALTAIFSQLITDYGQAFKNLLLGYAKDVRVRRVIGRQFGQQYQDSLFQLLEPRHFNFIKDVLSNAGLFDADTGDLTSIENDEQDTEQAQRKVNNDKLSRDKQRPYLVEFTLAFLVTERGSQFNKNMYLRSVVKDLAAHNNIATKSLTLLLISQLAHSQLNTEFKADMLGLLTDLLSEVDQEKAQVLTGEGHDATGDKTTLQAKQESAVGTRSSNEYFTDFLGLVSSDAVVTDAKLERLLESMGSKIKSTFSLIIDWLRSGSRFVESLFSALEPQAAQRFTDQLISFKFTNTDTQSFAAAVTEFASEADDAKQFYFELVQTILSNGNIDFDDITGRANAANSKVAKGKHSETEYSQAFHDLQRYVQDVVEEKRITSHFSLESQLRRVLDKPQEARKLLELVSVSDATVERFKAEVGEVLWGLLRESAELGQTSAEENANSVDKNRDGQSLSGDKSSANQSSAEGSAKEYLSAFIELMDAQTTVNQLSLEQLFVDMGSKRQGALALIIDQLRSSLALQQTLFNKLDVSAARYFIGELAQQKFSQSATAPDNFMSAVEDYAGGSTDVESFYTRITERLLLNKDIDFDLISEEVSKETSEEISEESSEKTREKNSEALDNINLHNAAFSDEFHELKFLVAGDADKTGISETSVATLIKTLITTVMQKPEEAQALLTLVKRSSTTLDKFRQQLGEVLWTSFYEVAAAEPDQDADTTLKAQSDFDQHPAYIDETDGKARPVSEQEAWLLDVYKLINRGQWDGSVDEWQNLLNEHPDTIEQVLRTEAKKSSVVQTLARKVDTEIQFKLIEFLAPKFADAIVDLVSSAHILESYIGRIDSTLGQTSSQVPEPETSESSTRSATASEKVKSQWLEFSFHYLLVDRGSEFNTKSYLRSVLRQIARRDNLDYDDMIFSLRTIASNLALPKEIMSNLTSILGDGPVVETEQKSARLSGVTDNPQRDSESQQTQSALVESHDIHRGFQVYQELVALLLKGHAASQIAVKDLMTELVRHHSAQFLQLVADLRKNQAHRAALFTMSDQPTLQLIVREMMHLSGHINDKDGLEMLHRVESYGRGLTHQRAFYAEVFSSLIDGQELNLGVITDKAYQTGENPESAVNADSVTQRAIDKPHSRKDKDRDSLVDYCETLLAEKGSGQDLQKLLAVFNATAPTLQPSSTLPEHLVSQCIEKAFSGDFRSLILFAQHLRIALTKAQLGLDLKEISQLHWQALMLYVQHSPQTFNADRLTQIYMSVVLDKAKKSVRGADTSSAIKAIHGAIFVDANMANHVRESLTDSLRSMSEQDLVQATSTEQSGSVEDSAEQKGDREETSSLQSSQASSRNAPQSDTVISTTSDKTRDAIEPQKQRPRRTVESEVPKPLQLNSQPGQGFPLQDEDVFENGVEVLGAGVVLIAPYISMLFSRLKLLDGNQFISEEHSAKGVHLLHYIVFGFTPLCFDELNVKPLFNLICGLEMEQCLPQEIELTESDEATCNGLLGSIIQQWSALGKTSVDGLRETFLQREGVLRYVTEQGWKLVVEESAYDVLLDRLPWSYATLRYQFMEDVLHVNWR